MIVMKTKNIIFIYILLLSFSFAQSALKIATVSYIKGSCYIENSIQDKSITPLAGNSIMNNDIIHSKEDSFCDIIFDDDATKIHIDENTRVKILSDNYSRVFEVYYGSVFVSNAKTHIKTYIQTLNNNIYVNNNNIWVNSYRDFDKVVSINYNANIYNYISNSQIILKPLTAYNIFSNGSVKIDNNLDLVPDYIEDESYLQVRKENRNKYDVYLNDYDLIPVYGRETEKRSFDDNGFKLGLTAGTRYMNNNEYLTFGLFPQYKHNNFIVYSKLNVYYDYFLKCSSFDDCEFTESGIYSNWESKNDILEKFHLRYHRSDYNNSFSIYAGEIPQVTFGHGYLVNKFSNYYEYPLRSDFGVNIDWKIDNDFLNFKFLVPSIREYFRDGGIFGMHASLFLSHRFPLTLGLGFVMDFNQFSQSPRVYDVDSSIDSRQIKAFELDFELDIIRSMNLDVSIYGELVGIWYPENIFYFRSDGLMPFSDDLRWRRGTWGVMAPGVSLLIDNKHEINFAFNFNSAAFYPSYFNTNYLYNRSLYYLTAQPFDFNTLGFNLVGNQIGMLNDFAINSTNMEFFVPKELYPILTNKINVFPLRGFSIDYKYNFRNKIEYYNAISVYTQNVGQEKIKSQTYYTFDAKLSIKENILRNLSSLNFYVSNVFFLERDDREEYTFGFNMMFDLPSDVYILFDIGQVFYDVSLNGKRNNVLNSGLQLRLNF